jgi:hypothetical protein
VAQLTIYLDDDTHRKVEAAAQRESLSLSRWAREHLARAAEQSGGSAWDHLSAFAGTAGEDFQLPERSKDQRPAPDFD